MSDLFCPATVIVARHAEAEYESVLAYDAGGSLTGVGRAQAVALGKSLRDRRIAAIWCSDMARAVQTAEIAAGVLGVAVRVRSGLREFAIGEYAGRPFSVDLMAPVMRAWERGERGIGCPGAETGADVTARVCAELEQVADQYRGETVLVVMHGGAMMVALPQLATNLPPGFVTGKSTADCGTSELVVDADGWVMRSWNSTPLEEYTQR